MATLKNLTKPKPQKLSVSPSLLMLAALLCGILALVFNLSALGTALENGHEGQATQKGRITQEKNAEAGKLEGSVRTENEASRRGNASPQKSTGSLTASLPQSTAKSEKAKASKEDLQYQIIFSTGCSAFQDWQSYVLFFHAAKTLKSAAPPLSAMENTHLTRIASGCSDEDAETMRKIHKEQIEIMTEHNNFHLHITPDFSHEHGDKKAYKYFNKPYGTKHWMEHVLGYKKGDLSNKHDNHIVILLDPDQIIMRPFANTFSKHPEKWRKRSALPYWDTIKTGQPFAQQYGFHNQWYDKTNITEVAKPSELPSPVQNMSRQMITENFAAGPPYIATGHDFYLIADKWSEFAVPVHKQYPFLLAEMFAYCLAAAHLNLPHQITQSFMISDAGAGGLEGWKQTIDSFSEKDVCVDGAIPQDRLPVILHYCQRYWLGKWFIGKYKLPKDFISCKAPLLRVPPNDIALKYNFAIQPGSGDKKEIKPDHVKRQAFMICYFIRALNEAATFFKTHHCQDESPNMEETFIFHDKIDI